MKTFAVVLCLSALTACGTAAATAHHSVPTAHSPVSVPVSVLSYADAGRVCAALNALGYGGSAVRTVESAYHVTAADITRARKIRCPG